MRISNNILYNSNLKPLSYGATIKMSPHPEHWDQRVLGAVLNSKTIADIVKENEKIGKNVEIRYYRYTSPHYPEIPAPDDVYLTVKGHKGDIFLSSHSTYKFIPGSFFENKQEKDVYHGPADIAKDLVNQIRDIDHTQNNLSNRKTLDDLKKLTGKIIYEPAVKVEPYG